MLYGTFWSTQRCARSMIEARVTGWAAAVRPSVAVSP